MHIDSITIENYKSFLEAQTLKFEPGFNLLVGTNNAGKTSVLDVIDLNVAISEPHRSVQTIPVYGGTLTTSSKLSESLTTRFSEVRRVGPGGNQYLFPVTPPNSTLSKEQIVEHARKFIVDDGEFRIITMFGAGSKSVTIVGSESFGGEAIPPGATNIHQAFVFYPHGSVVPNISVIGPSTANNADVSQINAYGTQFGGLIYRFDAQRRPGVRCSSYGNAVLNRESTNLAFCINHLQTNDSHGHRVLCSWIKRVFPSVAWIQAPPISTEFELRCLPQPPEARRDDLATPISRMGLGIGNVIAMLYVLLTAREPQVIAIDEPNAFLHPRALREMMAILESEGKQHQFIVTAHSADVLTAVNMQSITLLDFNGVTTQVQQVGPADLHSLRGGLADLGIRITDLHAKDQVFWVEGQTEELVMPQLLRWACPDVAAGTAVLRIERTGTFSKKGMEPEEVVKIYERLSMSSALVPPMVCILLDGETRDPQKRKALEVASGGKLRFLGRRMLENYLLSPAAVNAALAQLKFDTTCEIVCSAMLQATCTADIAKLVDEIDGANVLKKVFSEVTNATHEFRKTRDVPAMVSWLLDNDADFLIPLRGCLRTSFGI